MVDKVNISPGHTNVPASTARAFEYGPGHYIANGTTLIADLYDGSPAGHPTALAAGPYNAFNYTSASGLDATIETGEASVGGALLARDTTTTVTLAASTANQSVYLGWSVSAEDTVIVGTASAFGPDDPMLEIWRFDTDATTVTAATDVRPLGIENATSELFVLEGDESIARLDENETVSGSWNFTANTGVGGYDRNQSSTQSNSQYAGEPTFGAPWIYTHAIEAHAEGGTLSTLISLGDTGTGPTGSDEIALITNGNTNVRVGSDNLLHVLNGIDIQNGGTVAGGLDVSGTLTANNGTTVTGTITAQGGLSMSGSDIALNSNVLTIDTAAGGGEVTRRSNYDAAGGIMYRAQTNPAAGEALFSVLSSGGSERLRVDHDGTTSTTNDLQRNGNSVVASGDGTTERDIYESSTEPNWSDGDIWFKPK